MRVVVRRLCVGLALLSVGAGAAWAQAPQVPAGPAGSARIAFIHARQVLQQMPGYAKAESLLTKEYQTAEAQTRKMQAAWDSTTAAFTQASPMLTPSARSAKEKSLQVQQDSLQAKLQALKERVDGKERELLAPMQARLQAIIDGVRAEGNFAMVVDLDNPSSANIVSYDKSLDISDRVARRVTQSN